MQRLFVNSDEAAWVFNTTPQSIRRWVREGKLRKAAVDRPLLITMESMVELSGLNADTIAAFIETRQTQLASRQLQAA